MYLSASGLVCPVGLNAGSACAAMRAGIASFEELPYWDATVTPVLGAAVPDLNKQFGARLLELLSTALSDCLSKVPSGTIHEMPLLVGLAEPGRPGGGAWLAETIVADVQEALAVEFNPQLSRVIAGGHTAGFEGLKMAREILRTYNVPGCLVCGVDSYINASSLFWLDQHWRLKREDNIDGLIPGEAAAAIYVQRETPSDLSPNVKVAGLGFGREQVSVLTDDPLLGIGLSDAGRQALTEAGWGYHDLDFWLSDATGESYGFREHALAEARLARIVRSQNQPHWHMADSIGDTGAAAGVVQLVVAASAWDGAYAPGERAACFASAIPGGRAVALLQRSTN